VQTSDGATTVDSVASDSDDSEFWLRSVEMKKCNVVMHKASEWARFGRGQKL
jgi:hypothetical protein